MCFRFHSASPHLSQAYICHLYHLQLHPLGYKTLLLSRQFNAVLIFSTSTHRVTYPYYCSQTPFCTTLTYTILIFLNSTHRDAYRFYRHCSIPFTSYCTFPSLHWWPIFSYWWALYTIPKSRWYTCTRIYRWSWFRSRSRASSTWLLNDWTCRSRVIFQFSYSNCLYYITSFILWQFSMSRVASQAIKQQFFNHWPSWGAIPKKDKDHFWQRFKVMCCNFCTCKLSC